MGSNKSKPGTTTTTTTSKNRVEPVYHQQPSVRPTKKNNELVNMMNTDSMAYVFPKKGSNQNDQVYKQTYGYENTNDVDSRKKTTTTIYNTSPRQYHDTTNYYQPQTTRKQPEPVYKKPIQQESPRVVKNQQVYTARPTYIQQNIVSTQKPKPKPQPAHAPNNQLPIVYVPTKADPVVQHQPQEQQQKQYQQHQAVNNPVLIKRELWFHPSPPLRKRVMEYPMDWSHATAKTDTG